MTQGSMTYAGVREEERATPNRDIKCTCAHSHAHTCTHARTYTHSHAHTSMSSAAGQLGGHRQRTACTPRGDACPTQ